MYVWCPLEVICDRKKTQVCDSHLKFELSAQAQFTLKFEGNWVEISEVLTTFVTAQPSDVCQPQIGILTVNTNTLVPRYSVIKRRMQCYIQHTNPKLLA